MSRRVLRDVQADFRGGLNLAADPFQLAPNEVRRAAETVLNEFGGITKRLGSRRLNDSPVHASALKSGFAWLKGDGTQEVLLATNSLLYTTTYAFPATYVAEVGALDTTNPVWMKAFRNGSGECVFLADGGALNSWDGTTLTTNIAGSASTRVLETYNQRLYGITGNDQTIYWSAINNGDSLGNAGAGGGSAVVRTFGDQNLTGLAAFRSSLLLFHVSGISRFTGLTQDDIAIAAGAQGVTTEVGTIFPRSIVVTPDAVLFLTDRGFYAATEGGIQPVSTKLDPLIRTIDFSVDKYRIIGAHQRSTEEALWYIPGFGVMRLNLRVGGWTGPCAGGLTDPETTLMFDALDNDKKPIVLAGDDDGYLKLLDAAGVYRDNAAAAGTGGTAYTMNVQIRRQFFGDPAAYKSFKWVYLLAALRGSSNSGLSWLTEEGAGTYSFPPDDAASWGGAGLLWGAGVWSGISTRMLRVPVYGQGPYIDLTLTDSSATDVLLSRAESEGFDYGRRY